MAENTTMSASRTRPLSATAGAHSSRGQDLVAKAERADQQRKRAVADLTELTRTFATETTELKTSLTKVLRERDALESRRREAVNEAALLRKRNTDTTNRFDMVRQKSAQEIAALTKASQLERKQRADIEAKTARATERLERIEGERTALVKELEGMRGERDQYAADATRESTRATASEKRVNDLRVVNSEARQRVDVTEAARNSEGRTAARRLRQLEAGISTLKAKLAEAEAARALATTRQKQQEQELTKLRAMRTRLDETHSSLASEVAALRREMVSLTNVRTR